MTSCVLHVNDSFEIGSYIFHAQENVLVGSDGHIRELRFQSTQVLQVLVENVGRIVSKDELIAKVWGNLNVTDDSIVQCIADIRRALRDTERSLVQTVPKRGYRLVSQAGKTSHDSTYGHIDNIQRTGGEPFEVQLFSKIEKPLGERDATDVDAQIAMDLRRKIIKHTSATLAAASDRWFALNFATLAQAFAAAGKMAEETAKSNRGLPRDQQAILNMGLVDGRADSVIDSADPNNRTALARDFADIAGPGELIVSVDVRDALSEAVDTDFVDLGERHVREHGIPVRLFRVSFVHPLPSPGAQIFEADLLPTIAIVPFQPRFPEAAQQGVGEMLVDDIISVLARSNEVYVISRLSTSRFRQRSVSMDEIGKSLNADFVLTGRYALNDQTISLDLDLADARDSRVLWSDRLVERIDLSVDLVQQIVASVRRAIVLREVSEATSASAMMVRTSTLLIGAIGLMHRFSPDDFTAARRILDVVIERRPNEPLPLAWLARWHVLRVQQGWSDDPMADAQAALECTKQALDLDPKNVTALVAEGFVLTNLMRKLDEAEYRYSDAIEISPNDATGRLLRGTLFAFRGEGELATRDTERALHLAPFDPHRFFYQSLAASACIAAEDYQRALLLADASLRSNRTHTSTLRVKAVAHMRLGQEEEARNTAGQLLMLQPTLTISNWLQAAPSADFDVGQSFAATMREIGIPD